MIFSQPSPNGSTLLAIRFTDSSGLTEPLYVSTPDTVASLAPEDPSADVPYTLIDIRVSQPGYESVLSEQVQVFPGVETIQDFQLLPLPVIGDQSGMILPGSRQNL